jgi:hypothetical protein
VNGIDSSTSNSKLLKKEQSSTNKNFLEGGAIPSSSKTARKNLTPYQKY